MSKSTYNHQRSLVCSMLRQIRIDLGLRQADVARQLGEPQSFVSKYEAGERRLDLIEVYHICRILGITLSEFTDALEQAIDETQS